MSNQGWDGGCWIVLDIECEPVSGWHHPTEASAHATALPVGYFVRRERCNCNEPEWAGPPVVRTFGPEESA